MNGINAFIRVMRELVLSAVCPVRAISQQSGTLN